MRAKHHGESSDTLPCARVPSLLSLPLTLSLSTAPDRNKMAPRVSLSYPLLTRRGLHSRASARSSSGLIYLQSRFLSLKKSLLSCRGIDQLYLCHRQEFSELLAKWRRAMEHAADKSPGALPPGWDEIPGCINRDMWQSEENTSERKANLRDILFDGIHRQDRHGERVSLHNFVAAVMEIDPMLRVSRTLSRMRTLETSARITYDRSIPVKARQTTRMGTSLILPRATTILMNTRHRQWNPSPSGRNSQHGNHAPPGLQRGVDHLVKVIEYIEENDTHRKEQTWDPPVFRTHHLWEISNAIRNRSTLKPYLTYKEYLGCFMDLVENEKTPRIESYGFVRS